MVYVALVQRVVDTFKTQTALFGKDVLQPFYLLRAVGQHIEFVAFQQIVFQRLCEQVEILMEEWLLADVELER